ncbi:MAG: hypothetical protein ABJB47_05815 [Actinomycetota bacterium]
MAPRRNGYRLARAALAVPVVLTVLAACSGQSGGSSAPGSSPAGPSSTGPTASATPSAARKAAKPPAIVAVTKAGALVVLDSANGSVARTLVPGGVLGDEISVAPGGDTVYFAVHSGCLGKVESVPVTGGSPTMISKGTLPAISPDGSRLAIANDPALTSGCQPPGDQVSQKYTMVIRTLSTGTQAVYPMLPAGQNSGLPAPISHLSWSPDGTSIAVSIASVQDNEGWNVVLVDPAAAKDYLSGPGVQVIPVTGEPTARISYLREGVYLPNGNLFVSRACCGGFPVHNTSRLMWEVSPSGVLVHQVAIGFADLDHVSLAASPSGAWLLYLAGGALYVSHHGNKPSQLTAGMIAAAWK